MGTTLSTSISTGITLDSTTSPFTVTAAGTINAAGLYAVSSDFYGAYLSNGGVIRATDFGVTFALEGDILNHGTILATSAVSGFGIYLAKGGTLSNQTASALISGTTGGVDLKAAGALDNAGTIAATGNSGYALALYGAGEVTNTGTIRAAAQGGVGAMLGNGDTLVNRGPGALVSGGQIGIVLRNRAGVVVNDSTITGTNFNADGIQLDTEGTITNAAGASITGGATGVDGEPGADSVTLLNAGAIKGFSGAGVAIANAAYLTNLATGTITGATSAIYLGNSFTTPADAGSIANAGTITTSGSAAITANFGGYIDNYGTAALISGGQDGIFTNAAATILNAGTISGTQHAIDFAGTGANRLIVESGAVFSATVTATNLGSNTLELGLSPGSLAGIGTEFLNFTNIQFDPGVSWTLAGNSAGLADGEIIAGFTTGNLIDLTGIAASGERLSGGILTLTSDARPIATLNVTGPSGLSGTQYFSLNPDGHGGTDITSDMPCFAENTRILTLDGDRYVQRLSVGDILVTVRPGGPASQKIIWIGHRALDLARQPEPALLRPVRICAGAIAPGLPERDLRLSPHHAIFLNGHLFEAIALVNGTSIFQEPTTRSVTYYHVELAAHDIILAEGLPTESFLDTGNRAMFSGQDMTTLHPRFRNPSNARLCAPLVLAGPALEAARAAINARACVTSQKEGAFLKKSPAKNF